MCCEHLYDNRSRDTWIHETLSLTAVSPTPIVRLRAFTCTLHSCSQDQSMSNPAMRHDQPLHSCNPLSSNQQSSCRSANNARNDRCIIRKKWWGISYPGRVHLHKHLYTWIHQQKWRPEQGKRCRYNMQRSPLFHKLITFVTTIHPNSPPFLPKKQTTSGKASRIVNYVICWVSSGYPRKMHKERLTGLSFHGHGFSMNHHRYMHTEKQTPSTSTIEDWRYIPLLDNISFVTKSQLCSCSKCNKINEAKKNQKQFET